MLVKTHPAIPASSVVSGGAKSIGEDAEAVSSPNFANDSEKVSVMVELADKPGALVYAEALESQKSLMRGPMTKEKLESAKAAAAVQSRTHVSKVETAQQSVLSRLASGKFDAKVIFRTKSAYNGISIQTTRGAIATISRLPGVKAVHMQIPKFRTAASDIDFLNARAAWTTITAGAPSGIHGEGVKIGIIDSGLDYVHANFGGNADYTGVTDTNPNGHFPTTKVPGGYDFAGDSYSAGVQDTPFPDNNPMDSTNGHGTACASLIGGFGVNADGSTYSGTYDNATDIASLRISPGFAPNAALYPFRVFGVSGSTNLVTQAIDYATDPNGDGILHRPYGRDQHVAWLEHRRA